MGIVAIAMLSSKNQTRRQMPRKGSPNPDGCSTHIEVIHGGYASSTRLACGCETLSEKYVNR